MDFMNSWSAPVIYWELLCDKIGGFLIHAEFFFWDMETMCQDIKLHSWVARERLDSVFEASKNQ